ncbi:uncharacterized protein LOC127291630 [Leptopilina boulardi]|uniref:uncharacterized protein LOC127291630 n=1 Tax=Leptopilina boulardi TaxID=63433 RepID=UPI0021F614D6|nr:uncharacterized protein LOC127291630 [Leptopilina boulardi]
MFLLITEVNRLLNLAASIKQYVNAPTSHMTLRKRRGRPRKVDVLSSSSTSVPFLSSKIEEYENILICAREHVNELDKIVVETISDPVSRPKTCTHLTTSNISICQGIPGSSHQFCTCGLFLTDDAPCSCRKGLSYSYASTPENQREFAPAMQANEPIAGPSSFCYPSIKVEKVDVDSDTSF